MDLRPILKPTFDDSVPEPDGPSESTSGSSTSKVKPGPLSLPFATCSQAQFLLLHSPHVHFPPTPRLVRSGITHSPGTYDRAPIEVSPNQCEMPARGCRVYEIGGGNDTSRRRVGTPGPGPTPNSKTRSAGADDGDVESYFDPRTFEPRRGAVKYFGQEEGDASVDNDHQGPHNEWRVSAKTRTVPPRMSLSALRASRSAPESPRSYSSSSPSPSESESDDSEFTCAPQTREIPRDFSAHPSPTLNTLTITLLPHPYPCPVQSAPLPLKKKRSSSMCGDTTRGWRRRLPPTRSRSIDSLTYAGWNMDITHSGNINKRRGSIGITDPSLDGCLGGF